jgi:hypothetical protein
MTVMSNILVYNRSVVAIMTVMSNILVYNRSVVVIMTVCRRYKYKYWLTMDPMRRWYNKIPKPLLTHSLSVAFPPSTK